MATEGIQEYTYSMESHFFRTLLETALVQHFPSGHSFNIRGLPRKKSFTFPDYSRLAVARMIKQQQTNNNSPGNNTSNTQPSGADVASLLPVLDRKYDELKGFYHHVNATLLLRSVMAPVLESFILLDRFLYLRECGGVIPLLLPLFDEALSPRNMAIVAFKSV